MISQRFKLKIPLLILVAEDGAYRTRHVPTGDSVTILNGPLDGVRLVEVKWRETTGLMITAELREHADLVAGVAS